MGPIGITTLSHSDQISLVKTGLSTPLVAKESWYIISCDWYRCWKDFVNFNNIPGYEATRPGQIINEHLLEEDANGESHLRQLRANCIEGLDFFTLPAKVYNVLKDIYGSDIDIERKVIMVGKNDYNDGVAQIEMNPIRVNVYVVKTDEDGSDEMLKFLPPTEVFQFSRQCQLLAAVNTIVDKLALDPPPPYSEDTSSDPQTSSAQVLSLTRFWAKTSTTAAGSSRENDDIMLGSSSSNMAVAVPPTLFTKEKTDFAGDYMFLRDLGTEKTSDYDDLILENAVDMNGKVLDLVVEVGSVSDNNDVKWPRDEQLYSWTKKIAVGDLIGASDRYKEWFEAVVVHISPSSMTVHFKGWSKKFDEVIEEKDYKHRIAPLYTKTTNWRAALKKGSEIEYTMTINEDGSKWLPAFVTEVDETFDTITIKYKKSDNTVVLASDIDLDSEEICKKNTHISGPDWCFHDDEPERVPQRYVSTTATITSTAARSPYNYYSRPSSGHHVGSPVVSGAVGLANLGNTCFMNSTLQCLSNTPGLTRLFLEDRYANQVNYNNVLGHKGQLANVYAKLIKDMWSDKYTVVRPEEFKRSIGEFAPQFSGYQQHDSSELMMFLLDGLHEDMNRVLKKPAVEKIESKGRDDDLISAESWRRYLLRNDSELVDLCFGQLKSHVTCTGCGYESVTFDEYSSLSLPLPMKSSQELSITLYPLPIGSRPIKIAITVNVSASVQEVCSLIAGDPLFKKTVESRNHSELGKRKTATDSSYLLVDSDTLDTQKEMEIDECVSKSNIKETSSYSDIETLGDISIENDNDDSVVLVSNVSPKVDSHHFHVCSLVTSYDNARIQKTFDSAETIRDSSDVTLVAYEMPHEVPIDNYSYRSYRAGEETASYAYFDLLVGVQKVAPVRTTSMNPVYSGYTRDLGFKAAGYPIRIPYEKGVTTREEINIIIFEAVKVAYELSDAYSPSQLPYVLHTTSSFANMSKGVVKLSEDKCQDAFTIASYDVLFCCWKKEALALNTDTSDDGKSTNDSDDDGVSVSAVDIDEIPNVDPEMVQRWLDDGIYATCNGNGKGSDGIMRSKNKNILNCFDKFIEREQMPAEETWYCPNCKQHLAPIKKFDVWSAPEILVVHLKRFQYSSRASFTYREKVNDVIDFPIEGLDLNQYVKSSQSANDQTPAIYDLYGVSEHSGTMGGGHYTAKCKNDVNGKWYSFNDSHVSECTPQSAVSSEAYVLFYKRRHGHLKWGGLVPSAIPIDN